MTNSFNNLFFVELALVTHKPRAASAYAVGTVRCAGIQSASSVVYAAYSVL